MVNDGSFLEELVQKFEHIIGGEGITLTPNDKVQGVLSRTIREIDLSLRGQVGSAAVHVIVECRDRSRVQDLTWIEQLASKRDDVGAGLAVAVSSSGFSSAAVQMAAAKQVLLRSVRDLSTDEIKQWFSLPALYFQSVEVVNYVVRPHLDTTGGTNPRLYDGSLGMDELVVAIEGEANPTSVRKLAGQMLNQLIEWCFRNANHDARPPLAPGEEWLPPPVIGSSVFDIENNVTILGKTIRRITLDYHLQFKIKRQLITVAKEYRGEGFVAGASLAQVGLAVEQLPTGAFITTFVSKDGDRQSIQLRYSLKPPLP